MALASRFRHLALPVATALMHTRPRRVFPKVKREAIGGIPNDVELGASVFQQLDVSEIVPELYTEPWLSPGAVDTMGFPDIKA
jgi:hypothetical protein